METSQSIKSVIRVVFVAVVMPLLLWQCGQQDNLVGNYHAADAGPDGRISATLALEANGKGIWSIETDNAPFRWDVRQNKIRLHTQSGGVIEGTIDNGTIHIALPGMDVILFERVSGQ
ncbi:MAG: hypothetical protein KQI81_20785 [Deltaproteobacteria bacterium]|nr:hypothetical protein [Deltaproteobacteria bacterium]